MSDRIIHCVSIRLRTTGSGVLRPRLIALDETTAQILPTLTLATVNRVLPTRLANFEQQYMQLELTTTALDEHVIINKITLFMKPVADEYPG